MQIIKIDTWKCTYLYNLYKDIHKTINISIFLNYIKEIYFEKMIIPVKCFTCGKVLADKHEWYLSQVRTRKLNSKANEGCNINSVSYLDMNKVEKTIEGKVMDELCLSKMCCRRHMLTHVNIE